VKIINAIKLLKSGKMVREQQYGLTIYRLNNNEIFRKTLNFPWESNGNLKDFQNKFQKESFEEIIDSKDCGLGYKIKY
jgi:hypothetical protein